MFRRHGFSRWILSAATTLACVAGPGKMARASVAEETAPAEAPVAAPASEGEAADAAGPAPASREATKPDPELERLRAERDRIAAANALAAEQLRQELFTLDSEKQRLALENGLRTERLNAEVGAMRTKVDKLALEIEALNRQNSLEAAQRRDQLDRELADLRAEDERLRLASSIATQKAESRMAEMRVQESEYKVQRAQLEMDVLRLQTQLSRREKSEILRDIVADEQKYTKEPFRDGMLLISDRRIALNGVIMPAVADHVAEQIDYFNNQNTEFPIFIVIDNSPGGSVMAGYKILKAMEGSKAPVYVVLKSFAASMSAVIVTMAQKSYAYPNAIMLHHQISWLGMGNLTQQREQLDEAEQWWRRLALPVATKMGLTLDQFIAQMYQKNSDGDWREFADGARQIKWLDEVANTIWETSMDKNPERFGPRPAVAVQFEEKADETGNPYAVLPRLPPFDYYFLYNPDHYYRLR